jgi:ABC-2 type transport system permease protein
MTAFFALVRKDLILFLSDRRALLISLALPIVIGSFFGMLFGGSGKQGGAIDVALVVQDSSDAGARIANGLMDDPNLRVISMSLDEAQQAVRKGKQKVAIVLPSGFGEHAGDALFGAQARPEISLLYDPSQPAVLGMVKGMLTQQVMQVVSADMFSVTGSGQERVGRYLSELEKKGGADAESQALRELLGSVQKYQGVQQGVKPAVMSMPFTTRDEALTSGGEEQGYNAYAHSFAGMGVQFILFMGIDLGIGILLARRTGVWNRLLAAPVSLSTVLMARMASGTVIAFGLICAIFAFATLAWGVHIASVPGFVGVGLSFALMTAGFGLLVAALGKTPEAARGIALFATLMMVMIGGAWIPSFLFPQWLQQVAMAVPARWAVDGLDAVTWRGFGLAEVAPAIVVLLGFAIAFAGVAVWKFGREQR